MIIIIIIIAPPSPPGWPIKYRYRRRYYFIITLRAVSVNLQFSRPVDHKYPPGGLPGPAGLRAAREPAPQYNYNNYCIVTVRSWRTGCRAGPVLQGLGARVNTFSGLRVYGTRCVWRRATFYRPILRFLRRFISSTILPSTPVLLSILSVRNNSRQYYYNRNNSSISLRFLLKCHFR